MLTSRTVVAAVLAGTLVVGCAGTGGEPGARPTAAGTSPTSPVVPTSAPSPDAGGSAAPAGPTHVPEELDFTAPTLAGDELRGAELAGRDVVLWMWAPW